MVLEELEAGVEGELYAFVMLEDQTTRAVSASKTVSASKSLDRGLVMRIVAAGLSFEFATNDFQARALRAAARGLREKALAHARAAGSPPAYRPLAWEEEDVASLCAEMRSQLPATLDSRTPVHFGVSLDPEHPLNLSFAQAQAQAARNYAALMQRAEGVLVNAGSLYRSIARHRVFMDREKRMSQSLLYSLQYMYGITPQGRMARDVQGGLCGFEGLALPGEADFDALIDRARRLSEARNLKPGRYPLITGPEVTGVIAHEAFGHTQEGDTCRLGRSIAPRLRRDKARVGNQQATIVNNPALFAMGKEAHGQNGSHYFDDEGQLARAQVILDRGYLSSPMNDLMSSLTGDINGTAPRTSNGKRESWRRPLLARQTNTYFTAGDASLEELIGMVKSGFLARFPHGGMEDPKGMGLTAGADFLEEIVDGKLTGSYFVGPRGGHVELSDSVPLLLSSIVAKSRVDAEDPPDARGDTEPYNKWGGCGKYHKESVFAGCGGPFILWKGIKCG
jgi:predicted Zn-dependent protease